VNGVITEKYLWQGLTRLLAVYNADDTLKMRFEYADARMPVTMTKGSETYYLAYDQVGTLKAVADASGTVVKKFEYDSFGNMISDSDPAFAVPFGFAGGLHDRDTGLVRFGYRDYDPETGRWTAKDPILFAGGDTDLYGYCVNDPVNLLDPEGKIALTPVAAIVAALIIGDVVADYFATNGESTHIIGEKEDLVAVTASTFSISPLILPIRLDFQFDLCSADLSYTGSVAVTLSGDTWDIFFREPENFLEEILIPIIIKKRERKQIG